ncbi:outer membrane lipoprotein carrier protein LolA [Agriterribacter sp.]|uniref:LolA family protein n=1 Tax=Agriterribacter sp. TaxID=2821509 RepID=UPI002C6EF11D|nr:outer membrane lipoprotein carrier protein LolA [Agriterribacter sp.]HRO44230.1 outer membrane lipoprotein carrier protein LolA [Agriterribacter sp.]HRQ18851.1 outer membrane lipoprotein carrier protein LolA [Agriterribacter sp.]
MREIVLTVILCTAVMAVKAQYPGYKLLADPSAFQTQFATASQKTNTIKSDFIQEKNLSLLAEKIVSKGKFWFRKENAIRMEYTQPFQYLMVINGSNVYIKDSQKENKISTKSNKLFQQINKIIIDCVNGRALQGNDFKVRIFEGSTAYLAELSPVDKNLKTFFSHVNMIIEKKDYAVSRIEMHEPSGDDTSLQFVNRQFNTPLADALFAIR